jgi:hypothetical protein
MARRKQEVIAVIISDGNSRVYKIHNFPDREKN